MPAISYRASVFLLALGLNLGFAARGIAGDEIAAVEGQVKLDGKPVSGARIIFHQGNGQFVGAKLNKDGKFKIDRVLVATHTVTVEFKGIPEKYASEETSALRVEVKNGTNVVNLQLASK